MKPISADEITEMISKELDAAGGHPIITSGRELAEKYHLTEQQKKVVDYFFINQYRNKNSNCHAGIIVISRESKARYKVAKRPSNGLKRKIYFPQ